MADVDLAQELERFLSLPRHPDGRIDYADAAEAAVVSCFLIYRGKILLLKRSGKVRSYQGKWCAVAGYLDEIKPLEDKAMQELRQELGIRPEHIERFVVGEPYTVVDSALQRTWRVFPMLALLRAPFEPRIDWEHTDYEWIDPLRLSQYDTVPMLGESLQRALSAL